MNKLAIGLAACAAACALHAGETRTWTQGSFSDFENGVIRKLSVRSDGLLSLAPQSRELLAASGAYLWALARDSKGNLYAGGGAGAKLHVIAAGGESRVLAEFDELEVHAVAVDASDRVYAATSPDGKVYRIAGGSKPEVFYDPGAKYIWALAFAPNGDLLVATGDPGEIHRVAPNGAGKVFFKIDETHIRSMAVDRAGNVVVGTEPGGLVVRVSPAGEGFVLFQMPKREVTAVAVAADGAIYAAAVGNRQPGTAAPRPAATAAPAPAQSTAIAVVNPPPSGGGSNVRAAAPPPASGPPAGIAGGSEVFRIEASGYPRRVWGHAQDVVYAIAVDRSGRPVLATGNKGSLYRVESPTVYTLLLSAPATQVTALLASADGALYAATANAAMVYEIGPALEREGEIESDVFDAGIYSSWGRLSLEAQWNGGRAAVATRSGNLDSPQKNWSPWSAAIADPKGGRIASPGARFIQWKATLTAASSGASPELDWVDVAYLEKNVAPDVDEIEMTAPNYRFPAPAASVFVPAQTLSLPPLGGRVAAPSSPAPTATNTTVTPAMQFAKGYVGARWLASDPNDDRMIYKVEIRGAGESEWKPLRDRIAEKYCSWDSTAYPDGEYRIRVTASDLPGNPPADALSTSAESDPFVIDNTPPAIGGLTAVRAGAKLNVRWKAADALNIITRAEYSLDGAEWAVAAPVGGLSDSKELEYALSLDAGPGEHTIAVRVRDDYDNDATAKTLVRP